MAPIRKRTSLSASKSTGRTILSAAGPATTPSIFPLARRKDTKPGTKSHKQQQQQQKRHQLLTRLNKSHIASSGISKPKRPLKRRRTGRAGAKENARSEKLLSTVSALADALPASTEWEDEVVGEMKNGGTSTGEEGTVTAGKVTEVSRVKMRVKKTGKSMKNRPGSMKKRAKVEKAEKERFGMNLAVLAGLGGEDERLRMEGDEEGTGASNTRDHPGMNQEQDLSDRWQILRNYIKLTV